MSTDIKQEKPHITEEEYWLIYAEARSRETRLFIMSLWETGLRINEVLNLKAGDLAIDHGKFSLVVTRLKKRKSVAEMLPIPMDYGLAIRDYANDNDIRPSERLFSGHENTYRYQLRECARRAGIGRQVHPHMFRHAFVYRKLKGNKIELVSKLVGHSRVTTTMEYFAPTLDDLREAMER